MNSSKEIKHRLEIRREKVLHFRLTEEKEKQLYDIVFKTTGTNSLRKYMEEVVLPSFSSEIKQLNHSKRISSPVHKEPFIVELKGCAKNLNQFMAFVNSKEKRGAVDYKSIEPYCKRISRILDNLKIIMESENYIIDKD